MTIHTRSSVLRDTIDYLIATRRDYEHHLTLIGYDGGETATEFVEWLHQVADRQQDEEAGVELLGDGDDLGD